MNTLKAEKRTMDVKAKQLRRSGYVVELNGGRGRAPFPKVAFPLPPNPLPLFPKTFNRVYGAGRQGCLL